MTGSGGADPTGWFEPLYAAAGDGSAVLPWARGGPHPLLAPWTSALGLRGDGRPALVVGSGPGDDAELVAALGFDTLAFDIAPSAIRMARARFPDSAVDYRTADLLDPPVEWEQAFELVVEIFTVQSLPDPPRARAIVNVGRMVAPGGTLLVVAEVRDGAPRAGPPWPLARSEVEAFATGGLEPVRIERVAAPGKPGEHRWRAQFSRPPD